jgi:hypothetical protein
LRKRHCRSAEHHDHFHSKPLSDYQYNTSARTNQEVEVANEFIFSDQSGCETQLAVRVDDADDLKTGSESINGFSACVHVLITACVL